ncbi:hypothetical protein P3T27_003201 [Kitasatospora sp. MAA19]|uniref:hypothetical protein n=1 Tax=Kitasatospora sp. MAA19 TaxID=3035090 RepID=UPI002476DF93|nr:hypothetical protein [Kitasatospora sp. MAA19]MDH6706478.1 hypothetical protein [Kitasatospora sp. MAA19]
MSTVHAAPRVPIQKSVLTVPSVPTAPAGSTAVTAPGGRRRGPLVTAVRNLGIALDTAARVVFLGRDGVRY